MSTRDRREAQRHPSGPQGKGLGAALATRNGERGQAEAALRRAELRYRLLFEQAPVMYVISRDEAGVPIITDCNELFLSTLGYDSRADVVGRPLGDFYGPESRAELLEHGGFQRALEGRFVAEERQLVTRDGRVVETMLRAVPELDADGRTIGTRAMFVDITERKRAEEASGYQVQLLASVNDAIMSTDKQLVVRSWNPAAERIYGWKADEVIGQAAWEVFRSEFVGWPEEEELRRQLVGNERAQAIRTLMETGRFHGELIQYRKDGTPVYIDARGIALRDSRGQITGYVSVNRDITERKRAEEALRESEERFRLIAGTTSDVIWDSDLTTGRVWRSEGMQRLFGYGPSEEGARMTWWSGRIHPEDRDRVVTGIYAVITRGDESWFGEYRFRRADGSYAHVYDRSYVIRDSDGKPVRLIGGITDITERIQAEEALRTKDSAIASSISPIALADLDGNVTYVNPSLVKMWGFADEKDALGKPASAFWKTKEKALEVGKALRDRGNWTGEMVAIRRDGSAFDVEMMASMVADEAGNPICMMASVVDITDRKRAEVALRESERRYRLVAEGATDIIWIRDVKLRTTYVNAAVTRIRGYSVEEAMAQSLEDVLTPASLEIARKAFAEELAQGALERDLSWSRTLELEATCKDGSTVWLDNRVTALRDENWRVAGVLGISRDITERKRAEEELQEAREELESRVERRMSRGIAYGLSFRELTVLHEAAAGKSDKEIGTKLGISALTASKHMGNILRKMGAASRTEACVRALKEGLLDEQEARPRLTG